MNRMRKFDEDEPPKPPIVDGYDFVPDEPSKALTILDYVKIAAIVFGVSVLIGAAVGIGWRLVSQ